MYRIWKDHRSQDGAGFLGTLRTTDLVVLMYISSLVRCAGVWWSLMSGPCDPDIIVLSVSGIDHIRLDTAAASSGKWGAY